MKEIIELLLNYPTWVKITVVILGATIVMLLLIFRPSSAPRKNSLSDNEKDTSLNAGRDIVINNPNYLYLKDVYLREGILQEGWYGWKPSEEVLNNLTDDLAIFPIGLANQRLGFLVASSPKAHCKVELLYLKLKAYSPCHLRDEYTTVKEFMGLTTAAIHISEDYDIYPIYSINENLTKTSWVYQGKDVDEFAIYLSFTPYTLYLVSINIDYIDLISNKRRHMETDEFVLIDVAHGNTGGCLDVNRWFSDDMRLQPRRYNYDDGIPFDIYQLLTADFRGNPGLMNIFINNRSLVIRREEVAKVVNSRPENSVFSINFEAWSKALDGESIN